MTPQRVWREVHRRSMPRKRSTPITRCRSSEKANQEREIRRPPAPTISAGASRDERVEKCGPPSDTSARGDRGGEDEVMTGQETREGCMQNR